MKLADTRKLMEKHGIPGTDARDLPTSTKRFPDGAWYRMEISGIERPNVLEAAIDEMNKRKIPIHRMISMVMGATYMTKSEWKDFAQMAAEAKLEVIVTPGPRATWYTGRQIVTPEGGLSGLRFRGSDSSRRRGLQGLDLRGTRDRGEREGAREPGRRDVQPGGRPHRSRVRDHQAGL